MEIHFFVHSYHVIVSGFLLQDHIFYDEMLTWRKGHNRYIPWGSQFDSFNNEQAIIVPCDFCLMENDLRHSVGLLIF